MSLSKFKKSVTKSRIICKYFISGKCIKGENCPYLHSQIDKPKDMLEVECPMYSVGYCKNGPVCQFIHIKKDKFPEIDEKPEIIKKEEKIIEKEIEIDEDEISTPFAEDYLEESEKENNKNKNVNINNDINNNDKEINSHIIPIWYLEHYYDKPISMIFSELENQNLPEVIALQKKYGLIDEDDSLTSVQLSSKKSNLNTNTLNLNFNNFNMNFDLNRNFPSSNQQQFYSDINYNENFNDIVKDRIEYIINKDINVYYYLVKKKKYENIEKSYESNIIKLPEKLSNRYSHLDLLENDLTIIIIVYNKEYDSFAGIAKLLYSLSKENNENENLFKIEWLWKKKMKYSQVSHLMNRADHDHFLKESKSGCSIDKDLGKYLCRLMINRLTKEEVIELLNEKQMFENQMNYNNYMRNYDYIYEYDNGYGYYYDDYSYDYDDYENYYDNKYDYGANNFPKKQYKEKYYYDDYDDANDGSNEDKRYNKNNNHKYKNHEQKKINEKNDAKYVHIKRKRHRNKIHSNSIDRHKRYHEKKDRNKYSNSKYKKYKESNKKIFSLIVENNIPNK